MHWTSLTDHCVCPGTLRWQTTIGLSWPA